MFKTKLLLAPIAAAVLAACAVGPNYHAPESKPAEKFDGIETTYSAEQASSEKTIARFWQNFDDATLGRLVDEATTSNYDVRIALSRVAEARALRRDSAFDLAPSITAGGGYTKTKFAQDQAIENVLLHRQPLFWRDIGAELSRPARLRIAPCTGCFGRGNFEAIDFGGRAAGNAGEVQGVRTTPEYERSANEAENDPCEPFLALQPITNSLQHPLS